MSTTIDSLVSDEDRQGGTPCFPGTRVPGYILFDYIAHGYTVDEFLDEYDIERRKVVSLLSDVKNQIRKK